MKRLLGVILLLPFLYLLQLTNNGVHTYAKVDTDGAVGGADYDQIIKLVNTILFQALKLRASDVHFQSYPDRLQVRPVQCVSYRATVRSSQ